MEIPVNIVFVQYCKNLPPNLLFLLIAKTTVKIALSDQLIHLTKTWFVIYSLQGPSNQNLVFNPLPTLTFRCCQKSAMDSVNCSPGNVIRYFASNVSIPIVAHEYFNNPCPQRVPPPTGISISTSARALTFFHKPWPTPMPRFFDSFADHFALILCIPSLSPLLQKKDL